MAPSYRDYTLSVNKGDTLEKIAKEKNLSIDELLGANPNLSATQKLEQGQLIYLPGMYKRSQKNAERSEYSI